LDLRCRAHPLGDAEVTDFDHVLFGEEDIRSFQIPKIGVLSGEGGDEGLTGEEHYYHGDS